ncbi:protein RADIALIS-like 6 [Olea europaea var. sylvestris]|uniref:protein RADIALIS-like 6 n=1 Tax=Olea europaea var. sylvestris TaxID=158386 RepID=UPI000C1CDF9B|nr:protein RADIALIS-like 6 [Olea europaea var. sylvestris]
MASNSPWTPEENERFEDALAMYSENTSNRFHKIARAVGTKTVEEVRRHYEILVKDIIKIETDQIPLPKYRVITSNGRAYGNEQRQPMRNAKLQ